ncbi:CLUMA_CG002893, isoform A [Clunio marinus]|uniref:CLUMA_CG002893, isoform A n=1 Tax=Clunio marinus TaxID=568069 RepID=A0A1J1HP07_9DIPT|nr:CLUMA_CG002893, isoform A [Clunio marinus]
MNTTMMKNNFRKAIIRLDLFNLHIHAEVDKLIKLINFVHFGEPQGDEAAISWSILMDKQMIDAVVFD